MMEFICRGWVDELLVADGGMESWRQDQVLNEQLDQIVLSGVAVHRTISMGEPNGYSQIVEQLGGYTVLTDAIRSITLWEAFFKRTMDIIGGLMGCVVAGIALLLIGPILKMKSPGPVLFRQQRVGRNGKIFTMYKIRSMVPDAEARKHELDAQNRVADGMMFKLDFDPRIIGCKRLPDGTVQKGIGNLIREWSIDELPQFFNILMGQMSLVGTRPPTLDEWEKYEPQHRARMALRPGLTGLWQVSGRGEIKDFDEVLKLDMRYIREWNIGMDLRILFQTVRAVFSRRGAM